MKSYREKLFVIAVLLMFMFAGLRPLTAQDQPDQVGPTSPDQTDQNPPGRIAQLNYASGSVSFQPGGTGDWVAVDENRPLTTGDNIWADKDSRAELHIGATAIRLDSETSMTFLDLDDQAVQLRLSAGSMILRVRNLDGTFEVDTPNLAFDVERDGEYRLDVSPDGNETDVTTWQGSAEVTGGGSTYDVIADQQVRFSGTDQLDHEVSAIPASDDFVDWAFQRDQQEDQAEATNYVSPEMTGYQDLDAYGHWHDAGEYGMVWTPVGIGADWAPYRYGHWVWIAPWGWTWVEDEPWGFAPFHYGRWAYYQNSWCWVPGPLAVRPVYAPALVAFVGGGGFSVAVGVGGGPVGWFPLGPGEVFVPYYRTNRVYVQNINITNTRVSVTRITNVYDNRVTNIRYMNQRDPRAVTVVSRDTFVNARPVYRNVVRVNDQEIARAPVERNLGFQPARLSVLGASRPVSVRPPARIIERPVMATRVPVAPANRPGFEARSPEMNVREVRRGTPTPVGRVGMQPERPGFRVNEHPLPLGQNVPQGQRNNVPRPPETMREQAPSEVPPSARQENQPYRQTQPTHENYPEPQPNQEQRNRNEQSRPEPQTPRPDARPQPQSQPEFRPQQQGGQPEMRPQQQGGRPESRAPEQKAPEHKEEPPKSDHHEERPSK